MDKQGMIDLVNKYFSAVDAGDYPTVRQTLTEDCVFSVETHGVRLQSEAQIKAMFDRLWADHKVVLHRDFSYVADPESDCIAARFTVDNTLLDGSHVLKSNCNFFKVRDGRFCDVKVYMAGENTLLAG